jgi:hypothetical protein
MFASNAGIYTRALLKGIHSMCRASYYLQNLRNTLAYFVDGVSEREIGFITLQPGENVIKNFYDRNLRIFVIN